MKQLKQWLDKIEKMHPKAIDLGLERVQEVFNRLNLEFNFPVVMVSGTNGKGSTVAVLSKLLREAGLNVGTYTSPHLLKFNERIQINGDMVTDSMLCQAFEIIETHQQNTSLTFFEFTTLAAFSIFHRTAIALDIVILEIGLGGRLDAVNIVSPDLAIITSIGFDHQDYLGHTLEEIAAQKAGIIRKNIPVVLGSLAQNKVILEICNQYKNTVYQSNRDFGYEQPLLWEFKQEKTALPASYLPQESVSLACAAYTILGEMGFLLPNLCKVANCIKGAMMIGRKHNMILGSKEKPVSVMLDVAHNPMGSEWLANEIKKQSKGKKIIAVWASLLDKDLAKIIEPMKNLIQRWYIGDLVNVARFAPGPILHEALKNQGINQIFLFPTIKEAFDEAISSAKADEFVVVFGSFYTVSQVLGSLSFEDKALNDNGLGIYQHG